MDKDVPYEKWSRASFKLAYEEAEAMSNRMRNERDEARARLAEAEAATKKVRDQFDDLKTRLHAAESANQFMRGYLARVHEDDTVREELVTVGNPDGEQHMVPKRKPTQFERPSDFSEPVSDPNRYGGWVDRHRPPAKHWITY